MSEKKILNTITEIQRSGSSLGIYTYYLDNCLNSLKAFISNIVQIVGGVSIKENELYFNKTGLEDVSFSINSSGDLIVKSKTDKDFFINSDGELIMIEYDSECTSPSIDSFLSTEEGFYITEEDNELNFLTIEEN